MWHFIYCSAERTGYGKDFTILMNETTYILLLRVWQYNNDCHFAQYQSFCWLPFCLMKFYRMSIFWMSTINVILPNGIKPRVIFLNCLKVFVNENLLNAILPSVILQNVATLFEPNWTLGRKIIIPNISIFNLKCEPRPRANLIKLFLSVNYEFS
jgi:hypothetical protein